MKLEPELKGLDPGTVAWRAVVEALYPMAYQPWPEWEDELLRTQLRRGDSVADISKTHERRPGAIYSRIRKLGLPTTSDRGVERKESLEGPPTEHFKRFIDRQLEGAEMLQHLERNLQVAMSQFQAAAASAKEITAFLTHEISVWLEASGFSVKREKQIRYVNFSKGSVNATGFIDLWATRATSQDGSNSSFDQLAIEIDRSNKLRSVDKLLKASDNGAKAVWVRWRGTVRPVPDTISVIDLANFTDPPARFKAEHGWLPGSEEVHPPSKDHDCECSACERRVFETANFCGFCGNELNSQR